MMNTECNIFTILDDDAKQHESLKELIRADSVVKQTPIVKKKIGLTYEDRITIIREYFGVSEMCAIYLYHRRRRGAPWYKPGDSKYLEWTTKLQNAIIYLDTIAGFDWRGLEFGYEELQFVKNNIDVHTMPSDIFVLAESQQIYLKNNPDKDGFIKVEHSKINITKELNKMGLIPRMYCHAT